MTRQQRLFKALESARELFKMIDEQGTIAMESQFAQELANEMDQLLNKKTKGE